MLGLHQAQDLATSRISQSLTILEICVELFWPVPNRQAYAI